MSLFFVKINDDDWINGEKIQLIVKHCIGLVVELATSLDEVLTNDALNAIFDELTKHTSSKKFV